MALILSSEKTNTKRFASKLKRPGRYQLSPKNLKVILRKKSGRANSGKITVRHQGGREKRYYRLIDFKRDKFNMKGVVEALEYDPNRNVDLALIKYADGQRRYILAPLEIKAGDEVVSGERVDIKTGNALKLQNIPIGTVVHNVELVPGSGGKLGRSAGAGLIVQAKQDNFAHLKLSSGEIRMVPLKSMATVGILGNIDWKNIKLGKAGRSRHMGIRPTVRGTAQDPRSHPHGGGEARSGVGRKKPMTKYGRPAVGKTRQKGKYSDKYIIKRRSR